MGKFKFDKEFFKKVLAEFTGTAMVMVIGCVAHQHFKSALPAGLAWGFGYTLAIHTFLFMSGAHLNPSVSIAATILGAMNWVLMLFYLLAQFLGALFGWFLGWIVRWEPEHGLGGKLFCFDKHLYLPVEKIFGAELMFTIVLMFVYCAIWDSRSNGAYDSVSVRVGLVYATLVFVGYPYTGCHVNLARTFAPAITNLEFDKIWCYILGHLLAAVLVPLLWRFVIAESKPETIE